MEKVYKFVTSTKEGRIGIEAPYNEMFKAELKVMCPGAYWNGLKKIWFFDEKFKPVVQKLLDKYFPENLDTIRVTWQGIKTDNFKIDGVALAHVDRDYWNWRHGQPASFLVIEADLNPGGSRRNPWVTGDLIIEAHVRPGAVFSPKPTAFVILQSGYNEVTPLAGFSDEDLLGEMSNRGILSVDLGGDIFVGITIYSKDDRKVGHASFWSSEGRNDAQALERAITWCKGMEADFYKDGFYWSWGQNLD